MNRHDDAGPFGQRRGQPRLVEIQRVLANVDEHRPGTAQGEGVGAGGESKRRQDDLVALPDIQQQRRQLEGMSA